MKENNSYLTISGFTCHTPTSENTSCTGGTITDIYVPVTEENSQSNSYVITLKELKSCNGFEDLSNEQADEIINTLYQLSTICYRSILE